MGNKSSKEKSKRTIHTGQQRFKMGNKSSKEKSKRTIHTDDAVKGVTDAKFKKEIFMSSFSNEKKISRCISYVLTSSSASDLDSNLEDSTKKSSYKRSSFRRHESVTKYLKVLNCSTVSLNIYGRILDDSDQIDSGCHEVQVLNTDDVQEIKHSFLTCKKNPDHHQFIPVDNFDLKHLPSRCRDDDWYNLIKAASTLSVRLAVKCVSNQRPPFWPDKQRPYPFYGTPDNNRVRFGSGAIEQVTKYIRSENDVCPCKDCRFSASPKQSWGLVRVSTATHVVFDDLEAKHTTCRLFYDNETSPGVDLEVIKVDTSDVTSDSCVS
ncbi:uncharacterized protein LOC106062814 [Biomphalaria glabrata]|uniref:Uncharacterized protein LOC106062814 n=1 Tax=Biomphalaria glabrata TaxID=6526 RepID=A0A9W2ZDH9_BIOGL|nr:uncharacterized protein LOC106062814 [Biomphalaria glabrata]